METFLWISHAVACPMTYFTFTSELYSGIRQRAKSQEGARMSKRGAFGSLEPRKASPLICSSASNVLEQIWCQEKECQQKWVFKAHCQASIAEKKKKINKINSSDSATSAWSTDKQVRSHSHFKKTRPFSKWCFIKQLTEHLTRATPQRKTNSPN